MTNELTTTNTVKLPAYLLNILKHKPQAANIGEGITGSVPVIRVAGTQKEIAIDDGQLTKVKTLDIIIIGVNPNISMAVYDGKYDSKAEPTNPVFTSDDGTPVPAEHLNKNIAKSRRLAVLLADNPSAGLYEFRVPFASILDIDGWISKVRKSGVPVFGVVTTVSFSEAYDYPRFAFSSESFVTSEQAPLIDKFVGTPEVDSITRANKHADVPAQRESKVVGTVHTEKKSTAAKNVVTQPRVADDAEVAATLKSILG